MRLIDADALLTAFPVDDEPMLTKSCVRMTIQHMPTIEPEPQWTPCSEGEALPETSETCLIMNHGIIDIGYYDGHFWHFRDGNEFEKNKPMESGKDVQAWMPLPEPYKEDADERDHD